MAKKRVYELAKEMGLDNKELISRLEKIGIAVKSHSSTLEESDLARIQAELLAPEAREVVEKRIKSTVIRRRAVRTAPEEVPAAEVAPPPETKGGTPEGEKQAEAKPPERFGKAPGSSGNTPPGGPRQNIHLSGIAARHRRTQTCDAPGPPEETGKGQGDCPGAGG